MGGFSNSCAAGGEADAGWSGWKRDEDVFLFANTAT